MLGRDGFIYARQYRKRENGSAHFQKYVNTYLGGGVDLATYVSLTSHRRAGWAEGVLGVNNPLYVIRNGAAVKSLVGCGQGQKVNIWFINL